METLINWQSLLDYLHLNFGFYQQRDEIMGGKIFKFDRMLGELELSSLRRGVGDLLGTDDPVEVEYDKNDWLLINPFILSE